MEDRPDLIQSELTGMAFDSLQCVFRPADIEVMFTQEPPEPVLNADIYLFIDPAAGGPQSDYAILSFQRIKGLVTVSDYNQPHMPFHDTKYKLVTISMNLSTPMLSLLSHGSTTSCLIAKKKLSALRASSGSMQMFGKPLRTACFNSMSLSMSRKNSTRATSGSNSRISHSAPSRFMDCVT